MGRNARSQARRSVMTSILMATAALAPLALAAPALARPAAQQATRSYDIPGQPLSDALVIFSAQSGLQVAADGATVRGVASPGVRGLLTTRQALDRLLLGTGFTYRLNGAVVTLERGPQAQPGVVQLGAVRVEGAGDARTGAVGSSATAGWDGTAGTVYVTPGSVSVITRETLDAYPGTSPADMLKSESGVLSGESRNSGGLDVNIRGLQGQGRVAVTVDGAINGTTVYRGYQGTSNRSFIDPDFVGSVAIQKGPSNGNAIAGGIGGSVSMTTLTVDDVVPEGETSGLRFKLGLGTNTTEPGSSMRRSLIEPALWGGYEPLLATRGTHRPGALEPTNGSGSLVYGRKGDRFDLVAGYAFRRSGNYHAGTHGDGAPQRTDTPSEYCVSAPKDQQMTALCRRAMAFYDGYGTTPFAAGEEVLNTSTDTESVLLKATIRPAEGHAVELGYGGYWSSFGENYPGAMTNPTASVNQRRPLSETSLERFTSRYRWNPESDLIDLKINAWLSQLEESAPSLGQSDLSRRYIDTWGADLSNSSRVATPLGLFSADYGVSYLREEAGPIGKWAGVGNPPAREGVREETSLFTQMQLEPTAWLQLNGGLRYQDYSLEDRQSGVTYGSKINDRSEDAFGFSLGATVVPTDGLQLFANYKQAARLPSLMEATSGFFMLANPDLHKEEARNWEVGVNYVRSNLFAADDDLGLKLVWFDNDIHDYIARRYVRSLFQMQMYNIDRAQFRGLEASADYRIKGWSVAVGATWYDKILFCRPGEACVASSLASDYATNYIPPEFSANLSVSKTFLNDRAMIGGRIAYRGERAVDFEPTDSGFAPLLKAVPWDAYATVDLTGRYRVSDAVSLDWSVENLTDEYYLEALSLGVVPAPGRTFRIGLTGQLGAGSGAWLPNWFRRSNDDATDWTGPYVGANFGYGFGRSDGDVSDASGAPADAENGSRVELRLDNVVGGVHAGYNQQFANNLVLGLEGDLQAGALATWTGVLVRDPSSYTASLRAAGMLESDTDYSWDRIAGLRARVGYAMGRTLVYGAAGPAWLRETASRHQYRSIGSGDQGMSNALEHLFTETSRKTRSGWSLGAGLERDLGGRWSVRTEYLYSRFGEATHSFDEARAGAALAWSVTRIMRDPVTNAILRHPVTGAIMRETISSPGTSNITNGRKVRADADLHALRIGFSYRF
ncbi:hemoglobin/transferrin/lactoferrin receptor protein [Brevundimonas faecalis]|uniref:Hemoglobin/transferrin/lactoferrin receptor protein n=2 Tax=Brevundimonas faecalis TaxID=947378 RepID=A0ABV2RFD7_9CAUL